MKTNTLQSLETLGLSQKEALVYLALLNMKRGTAMTVAAAAGIKRPTAYLVLESLIQKKLVTSTTFRNVKDYRAYPLEHLQHFVYSQKTELDKNLTSLQALYDARKFKLRLRIYNGAAAVKVLLEKSLREEATMYIVGDDLAFADYLGDYWQFYLKRSQQHNIPPKFKKYKGAITLMVWNNKVAFAELKTGGQIFAFRNQELHDVYQTLWNNY